MISLSFSYDETFKPKYIDRYLPAETIFSKVYVNNKIRYMFVIENALSHCFVCKSTFGRIGSDHPLLYLI